MLVAQKGCLLAAKRTETSKEGVRRRLFWNPIWGALRRGAGGTLLGRLRQVEASSKPDEELALVGPPGTHVLNCDGNFAVLGRKSLRSDSGFGGRACPPQVPGR